MSQDRNVDIFEDSMTYTPDIDRETSMEFLENYLDKELLFSLQASQLSILNQTFRPLMVARLARIDEYYAYFIHVNIKMQNAPEFEFPMPLIIPINQIAWFMEFNRAIRFSIY